MPPAVGDGITEKMLVLLPPQLKHLGYDGAKERIKKLVCEGYLEIPEHKPPDWRLTASAVRALGEGNPAG